MNNRKLISLVVSVLASNGVNAKSQALVTRCDKAASDYISVQENAEIAKGSNSILYFDNQSIVFRANKELNSDKHKLSSGDCLIFNDEQAQKIKLLIGEININKLIKLALDEIMSIANFETFNDQSMQGGAVTFAFNNADAFAISKSEALNRLLSAENGIKMSKNLYGKELKTMIEFIKDTFDLEGVDLTKYNIQENTLQLFIVKNVEFILRARSTDEIINQIESSQKQEEAAIQIQRFWRNNYPVKSEGLTSRSDTNLSSQSSDIVKELISAGTSTDDMGSDQNDSQSEIYKHLIQEEDIEYMMRKMIERLEEAEEKAKIEAEAKVDLEVKLASNAAKAKASSEKLLEAKAISDAEIKRITEENSKEAADRLAEAERAKAEAELSQIANKEIQKQLDTVKKLNEEKGELVKDNAEIQKQLKAQVNLANAEIQKQAVGFEKQLAVLEKTKEAAEANARKLEEAVRLAENEKAESARQFEVKLASNMKKAEKANAEIEKQQGVVKKSNQEKDELSEQLGVSNKEKEGLAKQLQAKSEDAEELKNNHAIQVAKYEEDATKAREQLKEANAESQKAKAKLEEKAEALQAQAADAARLAEESKAKAAVAEIAKSSADAEIQKQLKGLQAKLEASKKEAKHSAEQEKKERENIEISTKNMMADFKKEIKELEAKNQKQAKELAAVKANAESEAKASSEKLAAANAAHDAEVEAVEENARKLEMQLSVSEKANAQTAEAARLAEANAKLEQSNQEKDELVKDNAESQKQLKDLQAKSAADEEKFNLVKVENQKIQTAKENAKTSHDLYLKTKESVESDSAYAEISVEVKGNIDQYVGNLQNEADVRYETNKCLRDALTEKDILAILMKETKMKLQNAKTFEDIDAIFDASEISKLLGKVNYKEKKFSNIKKQLIEKFNGKTAEQCKNNMPKSVGIQDEGYCSKFFEQQVSGISQLAFEKLTYMQGQDIPQEEWESELQCGIITNKYPKLDKELARKISVDMLKIALIKEKDMKKTIFKALKSVENSADIKSKVKELFANAKNAFKCKSELELAKDELTRKWHIIAEKTTMQKANEQLQKAKQEAQERSEG